MEGKEIRALFSERKIKYVHVVRLKSTGLCIM